MQILGGDRLSYPLTIHTDDAISERVLSERVTFPPPPRHDTSLVFPIPAMAERSSILSYVP